MFSISSRRSSPDSSRGRSSIDGAAAARPARLHGVARALAAGLLGLVAARLVTVTIVLLWGFLRGRLGDLPAVLEEMGETLARLNETLSAAGVPFPPSRRELHRGCGGLAARPRGPAARGHGGSRGLAHALLGAFAGVLVFFHGRTRRAGRSPRRCRAGAPFAFSFRSVAKAQIEISAVNTALTALFLFAVVPLFGAHLPLPGTLVAITFLCGLVPVVGNLVSNTVIVLVSLGVSPLAGVAALAFLFRSTSSSTS